MATEIEAASLLTHKASELKNQGKNVTTIGAMANIKPQKFVLVWPMKLYRFMVAMVLPKTFP